MLAYRERRARGVVAVGGSEFGDAGLAEAIGVVRSELEAAITTGAVSRVAFEAGPVELEFEVAFTKTGTGETGVKAWVITVGGSAEVSQARTHRMSVTLTPVDRATREKQLIGDIDREVPDAASAGGSMVDLESSPAGSPPPAPAPAGDVDTE
jgi:hypothetical protein